MNTRNPSSGFSIIHNFNTKEIKTRYKITTVLYLVYAMIMIYICSYRCNGAG